MSWPITWPDPAVPAAAGPNLKKLAEQYAVQALTVLTLGRVGGDPVTILPAPSLSTDRPGALDLPGPVGAIVKITIEGAVLGPGAYRVEDGRWLVRTDGGTWPGQGDGFTVTYYNSYPVDELGAHAGGVLAGEFLHLLTADKKCKLPPSVTNVSRQGLTFEITRGMFPEGVTGIPEIDAYLMLWNPWGVKVAPRVYSLDLPAPRQVF